LAGLLLFTARGALAVGPFVDVGRMSAFLRSPQRTSVSGSITRADGRGVEGSVFVLSADFPLQSAFLFQLEFPYLSAAYDKEVDDGFGDATFGLRARAWKGERKTFLVTGALKTGSGTSTLFPFSTGSIDVEAGLAFVDSVGVDSSATALEPLRSFSYWIAAAGVYPLRVEDSLRDSGLHTRYARAGGGALVALTRRIELEAGGMALFFPEGAVRPIYFSRLSFAFSEVSRISLVVQRETGDELDRAVNGSVGFDLTVMY
jgi:hypothetical protein